MELIGQATGSRLEELQAALAAFTDSFSLPIALHCQHPRGHLRWDLNTDHPSEGLLDWKQLRNKRPFRLRIRRSLLRREAYFIPNHPDLALILSERESLRQKALQKLALRRWHRVIELPPGEYARLWADQLHPLALSTLYQNPLPLISGQKKTRTGLSGPTRSCTGPGWRLFRTVQDSPLCWLSALQRLNPKEVGLS